MRALLLLAVPLLLTGAEPPERAGRYLKVAATFVETMMDRGTDRYGREHSPLFAAILDLNTLSLPVQHMPAELKPLNSGLMNSIGYGLPDLPVGIRSIDRAPFGNNMEQDIMLLEAMYELSAITGQKKYAAHADAYLAFWLAHCQSPVTGLFPSGEHASWNFLTEEPYADVHEVARKFPFYDKLYAIDPFRALKQADGLWLAQIFNKKTGDFSRHAGLMHYRPEPGWNFPRHAGFYIWAYANAYAQSRDPKFLERADMLIESATGKRARPESLLLDPAFKPENSLDPTLRLMLWDAAALAPEPKRSNWRKIVRQMDEEAFAEAAHPRVWRWGVQSEEDKQQEQRSRQKWIRMYPQLQKHGRIMNVRGSLQTDSTTLSPAWNMGYGSAGYGGKGLMAYTRFQQTGSVRFLREAEQFADKYLAEGFPKITTDLWPQACGQVISLLVALAREKEIDAAKQTRYMEFAHLVADRSIDIFSKNGLFRADGAADHYEAITGADDLVWALLQLYCADARPDHPLHHDDVNW